MSLSKREIAGLLNLIGSTRDQEIDCENCLAMVAEFAEFQLAGRPLREGLEAVEHHLQICTDCREEYEALQRALESLED